MLIYTLTFSIREQEPRILQAFTCKDCDVPERMKYSGTGRNITYNECNDIAVEMSYAESSLGHKTKRMLINADLEELNLFS